VIDLYLIRHGEAEVNVRRIVGGARGDIGLTPRGVMQVERLRDRLAATGEIAADVLVASTFARARQTAEILAPALGLPVELDDEVQEMRPGEADGMPLDEAMTRYGIPDFLRDPHRAVSPGGESRRGFMDRVAAAMDRLTTAHAGRTLVVVTHGGVIDGAFGHFLGMDPDALGRAQFATRHASITHWQRRPRFDGTEGFRLAAFNDAAHLHDLDRSVRIPWAGLRAPSRGR
jgi:probable phosphoglycerate mutase